MSAPAGLDFAAVESFLDRHPELVEKWLKRRSSLLAQAAPEAEERPGHSSNGTPTALGGPGSSLAKGGPVAPPETAAGGLQRRASQKELRRSFARSKAIHVNLTYDEHVHARAQEPLSSARRRALLRKASSLPPTTAHILSALLESRVNLPQYPPTALDYKRHLKEHNERQFFLELVKDISNDLDLGALSYKILIFVCLMVDADRGSLFLVEGGAAAGKKSLVSKVFDVHAGTPLLPCYSTENSNEVQVPWGKGIIGYVAEHGETVNIPDAYQDRRFNDEIDKLTGYKTKSLLCMPIRNSEGEILGVAQAINKTPGGAPFTDDDEKVRYFFLFAWQKGMLIGDDTYDIEKVLANKLFIAWLRVAFVIFCGLGINNTIMYDQVNKSWAKQSVALDVLSYHATCSKAEVDKFKAANIPLVSELGIDNIHFDDFSLDTDAMITAALRMFMELGMVQKFKIDYETLCRWLLTVRKNYRMVLYHNWRHAFNVCQLMFAMLTTAGFQEILTEIEILALIVGCLCHDLDHRGTNNAFQAKIGSALAQLYGTSATLEHHHFNHAVMILQSEGHNIFANLSSKDYSDLMQLLKKSILATDLTLYFERRTEFFELVNKGDYNWNVKSQREIFRSMLMTACDLGAATKPWEISRQVAELVTSEFFEQGDRERSELKLTPSAIFDRNRKDELPRLQLEWIDSICTPLYQALVKVNGKLKPMMDSVVANRNRWEELHQKRLHSQATSTTTTSSPSSSSTFAMSRGVIN
uniref:dual 3',5'-cyclic-AMP and -GMP phosphodiesterase 11A n=1 Tax=Podarcis muralis TaxID=64176 RepID=UPI0010A013A6|nr:dual 3',5'-cyclic-AMP and -GMP phosphodiesterase 11A [Podarcis muralis]